MKLEFSEASLQAWAQGDGLTTVDPGDSDRFSIEDGILTPGLHPVGKPWTGAADDHMVMGADGGAVQIHLFTNKVGLTGPTPADAIALASLVMQNFTALKNAFDTWVPVPNDGGAALKTIMGILAAGGWPFAVKSDKVLSD